MSDDTSQSQVTDRFRGSCPVNDPASQLSLPRLRQRWASLVAVFGECTGYSILSTPPNINGANVTLELTFGDAPIQTLSHFNSQGFIARAEGVPVLARILEAATENGFVAGAGADARRFVLLSYKVACEPAG